MRGWWWIAVIAMMLSGCGSLSKRERAQAADYAHAEHANALTCVSVDESCKPLDSLLREFGVAAIAASTAQQPRHRVALLETGAEALSVRLNLIRSARKTIDLQSFIFEKDESGKLVLNALLDAARRGVRVRVLLDQLWGLNHPTLQAGLASYSPNFQLRLYNSTFGEAKTQKLEFAASIICCFKRFNQRMHTKLLLVDELVGITGGRNIQDKYFDWNENYNYRDRDILVAGPAVKPMAENFQAFWDGERSMPAEQLKDVAERLYNHQGSPAYALDDLKQPLSARAQAMSDTANDSQRLVDGLSVYTFDVGRIDFIADLPEKHQGAQARWRDASIQARQLWTDARSEVLLQTPYLVMSRPARKTLRDLVKRPSPPQIRVSTNSLAATDAFPVYAMSHKYKRLYLHDLKMQIHEFKPFPANVPVDTAATGALGEQHAINAARLPLFGSGSASRATGPVPLKRAGVRVGIHSKSAVIDRRIGIVGSHNFDPRSDHYNTESLVVIHDAVFAEALAKLIERDMLPENAWLIAPRRKPPVFSTISYGLGRFSEALPIFDIWPFPYASSFELKPGCIPLRPQDPNFYDCYEDVGAFPEVNLTSKAIYTRIVTAFGAGLKPIL